MAPPDCERYAFSEQPPWIVDPARCSWLPGLAAERERVRRDVPRLVRPRRLPPGARVATVVGRLGWALGTWAASERRQGGSTSKRGVSRRLRRAAEQLGPTWIKLGQIISSGEGLFPEELVSEFRLLRDQVPAEPWPVVREVVEADLGQPLDEVFSSFDHEPLAAASIAQVHAATLRTGEQVVVKVQRPSVARLVERDLAAMSWVAPFLVGRIPVSALANPPALVELFAETISEELDFRLEAANMLDVAESLVALGQRGFVIPRPHPTLVTRRVLVMERLRGFAFDEVAAMRAAGVDLHEVVRTQMVALIEGALICGIFHGDLHGGNLFVLPDGRTALLDFGITARLDEARRVAFLRLLVTATMNDPVGQLAALRDLGALPPDTDLQAVATDLGLDRPPVDPTTLDREALVEEMQRTVKALLGYGARMPKELMLYVKDMVFLDGAIATLAPDLDLLAEITGIAMRFQSRHGEQLARDVGLDPSAARIDLSGIKAGFGVDVEAERLTYAELRKRRELISRRLAGHATE